MRGTGCVVSVRGHGERFGPGPEGRRRGGHARDQGSARSRAMMTYGTGFPKNSSPGWMMRQPSRR